MPNARRIPALDLARRPARLLTALALIAACCPAPTLSAQTTPAPEAPEAPEAPRTPGAPGRAPSPEIAPDPGSALQSTPETPEAPDTPGLKAPTSDEPAIWRSLHALFNAHPRPTHYRARFTQTRTSPVLQNPLISEGTLTVVGERSLWHTHTPEPIVMAMTPTAMTVYYPQDQEAEVFDLSQTQPGATNLGPAADLNTLEQTCQAKHLDASQPGAWTLTLTPRPGVWHGTIDQLTLRIDPATGTLLTLTTHAGDAQTTLTFSDLQTDPAPTEKDAALTLPPGTHIHRPGPAQP